MVMVWATRKRLVHVGPWMSAVCLRAQGSSQFGWTELASTFFFATPAPAATLGALQWIRAIYEPEMHMRSCLRHLYHVLFTQLSLSLARGQVCSSYYDFWPTLNKERYISGRFCGVEARRPMHTHSTLTPYLPYLTFHTKPATASSYFRYIINKRHVEREYAQ